MRTVMYARHFTVLLFLLCLAIGGCGGEEEIEDESGRSIGSADGIGRSQAETPAQIDLQPQMATDYVLGGKLLVSQLVFDVDAQTYVLDLDNEAKDRVKMRYRVHFFDESAQLFGSPTDWSQKDVPGRHRLRLRGNGPTYDMSGRRTPTYLAVECQPM